MVFETTAIPGLATSARGCLTDSRISTLFDADIRVHGITTDAMRHDYDELILRTIPRYRELIRTVVDQVPLSSGIRVLDAGCGTGAVSSEVLLREPGADVTLLDASEDMLSSARERIGGGHAYVCGDIRDMPFPDSSFDAVLCMLSTHYLRGYERPAFLEGVKRVLRPGGVFVYCEHTFPGGDADAQVVDEWRAFLITNGRTREEADVYLSRRGRVHFPLSPERHIALLEGAGFADARMVLCSYPQAVFSARRYLL